MVFQWISLYLAILAADVTQNLKPDTRARDEDARGKEGAAKIISRYPYVSSKPTPLTSPWATTGQW